MSSKVNNITHSNVLFCNTSVNTQRLHFEDVNMLQHETK